MFVAKGRGGYTRDGAQWSRGDFLIIAADDTAPPVDLESWQCSQCHETVSDPATMGPCGTPYSWAQHLRNEEFEKVRIDRWPTILGPRPPLPAVHAWAPQSAPALVAMVRHVRLSQLGHFMMGAARIGGASYTMSGAYGHDGLPCDLRDEWRQYAHPVPADLVRAFWRGGGHNTSGEEGPALRAWAREHLETLKGKVS